MQERHMLITVCERTITTEIFKNFEEARNTMLQEVERELAEYDETKDLCPLQPDVELAIPYLVEIGEDYAWSNLDDDNAYDWKIVAIPNE